jgi:hypothetical protein
VLDMWPPSDSQRRSSEEDSRHTEDVKSHRSPADELPAASRGLGDVRTSLVR